MEKFTAVFQQSGEWWTGHVEELPGANTQGRTLEEARENLKEAVRLIIEANRRIDFGSFQHRDNTPDVYALGFGREAMLMDVGNIYVGDLVRK